MISLRRPLAFYPARSAESRPEGRTVARDNGGGIGQGQGEHKA
jgi:hypothetical protein